MSTRNRYGAGRRTWLTVLLGALLLAAVGPACASMVLIDAEIRGTVVLDQSPGEIPSGVEVVLEGYRKTQTDASGNYHFSGSIYQEEPFVLSFRKDGYRSAQAEGRIPYNQKATETTVVKVKTVHLSPL